MMKIVAKMLYPSKAMRTTYQCLLWVIRDICSAKGQVRFTPASGHVQRKHQCPLRARSGHDVRYSVSSGQVRDDSTRSPKPIP
jgi:hypothetical protein